MSMCVCMFLLALFTYYAVENEVVLIQGELDVLLLLLTVLEVPDSWLVMCVRHE